MRLILDGGWVKGNIESESNNVIVRFRDFILSSLKDGKKVLIITNAKPVGYYNEKIKNFTDKGADFIDRDTKDKVEWYQYDVILALGGTTLVFFSELKRLNFNVDFLKQDMFYIGSSAGAMVMSSYFYDYDKTQYTVSFLDGFISNNKEIYLVHNNNDYYVDSFLRERTKDFASQNGLIVVPINENEIVEKDLN